MLITQAEYARHRGVSRAAVKHAVDAGRITLIDGKVDLEKADRDWRSKTNPALQRKKLEQTDKIVSVEVAPAGPDLGPEPEADPKDYAKSRAANEYWEARSRRLKTLVEEKRYVDLKAFTLIVKSFVINAKSRFEGLGNKLAPELAVESNEAACKSKLDEVVVEILSELEKWEPTVA